MKSGIYQILNKTTGKIYIGSAVHVAQRWRRHKFDLRSNSHHSIYLQRAWNKYGEGDFEFKILEACQEHELLIKEQSWINWTKCAKLGFNLTPTAGNSKGVKHSEETRKRMSEAKKNTSAETRERMRQARLGKKLSEEHKAKISASNKGRKFSQETRDKIGIANTGKIRSAETIAKIVKTRTGSRNKKKDEDMFSNLKAEDVIILNAPAMVY